jgi:hypothetical protein
LIPAQAFIYLLITFGVIFFFHHLKEWQNIGRPSVSVLSPGAMQRFVIYTVLLWISVIGLAVLYWEGLEGSPLHLVSYIAAAILANFGLLLKMILIQKKR